MNTHETQPRERYVGVITDTDRWRNFEHRPDDIFICTPPKCGTTWTQAICAMLVFGKVDHGQHPGLISPWIDASFAPIEEYLEKINSQTHRRFIKTHTPFDGIPWLPECTYLVVLRDPRDAFLSGLDHRDNLTDPNLAAIFPQGADAFEHWVSHRRAAPAWDEQTLELITHFLDTYWQVRDQPNVHLYHYSKMKQDLPGTIASIAKVLGYAYDDDQIRAFADAASFESMSSKAENFAPESGTGMWKQERNFFSTGKAGRWRDVLSTAQLETFHSQIEALLEPEQIAWLLDES